MSEIIQRSILQRSSDAWRHIDTVLYTRATAMASAVQVWASLHPQPTDRPTLSSIYDDLDTFEKVYDRMLDILRDKVNDDEPSNDDPPPAHGTPAPTSPQGYSRRDRYRLPGDASSGVGLD